MSWGLIVPPGLEPDGWCMPVCVVHAPLYVYHLYFSQNWKNPWKTWENVEKKAGTGKKHTDPGATSTSPGASHVPRDREMPRDDEFHN